MILLIASVGALFIVVVIIFLVQFYRNPERTIPEGNNIVSPADGRVIKILKTTHRDITIEKGMLGKIQTLSKEVAKESYVVSIFMSPVDVHYNRAPIAGKVKHVKHVPGKFLPVVTFKIGLENEHNEMLIVGKNIKVKVIQIAGIFARRIKCFVRESQSVEKGQRIGMICLGSQATLIMPAKVRLVVKEGQQMKAGESIIAELP